MKAVLNIVAAVLIAAGLVVAVASLLTPGQVILGIDFKLAATLLVGGLILHALARALALLERMSNDLRQLRKAGSEEPPWLRQSAGQFAAAMAPAAHAAPVPAEAAGADRSAEVEEDLGYDIAEEPAVAAEAPWPEAEAPATPEPDALEDETDSPFLEAETAEADTWLEPASEPEFDDEQAPEPAEWPVADEAEMVSEPEASDITTEDQTTASELEPTETATEDQADAASEPEPVKPATEDQADAVSEPEPAEAAAEDQAEVEREPAPADDAGEDHPKVASKLKPSQDAAKPTDEPTELPAEPAEAPQFHDEAAEEQPALYVVEERLFRGKQARVLSDGTIEAETAEGWMRFEDFDHLEEYLDAMADSGG